MEVLWLREGLADPAGSDDLSINGDKAPVGLRGETELGYSGRQGGVCQTEEECKHESQSKSGAKFLGTIIPAPLNGASTRDRSPQ